MHRIELVWVRETARRQNSFTSSPPKEFPWTTQSLKISRTSPFYFFFFKKDATNSRSISRAKQELQNRKQELPLKKAIFSNDQDSGKEGKEHSPEVKKKTNKFTAKASSNPAAGTASHDTSESHQISNRVLTPQLRFASRSGSSSPACSPAEAGGGASSVPPRLPVPRRLWGRAGGVVNRRKCFCRVERKRRRLFGPVPVQQPTQTPGEHSVNVWLCDLTGRPGLKKHVVKHSSPLFSFVFFHAQVKSMSHDSHMWLNGKSVSRYSACQQHANTKVHERHVLLEMRLAG